MRYLRLFSANVKIAGKFIGDIEFAPITVFCGSNASGKTMLLNFFFKIYLMSILTIILKVITLKNF